ncbi:MAG: cellulose biosynthesis cyclic di-GMP-binding regulatory protein BcsB [Chloroflexi bacterium]|nr:cellulose biosynthesis cyclic di-GMP-binding regulatory protein BcsB [Chloroflexota bacterium]MCI0646628.1 cellulose biosynthesis cyclic di-GMP-binding regulatory protein BcsB [Chloroflexota bacterium]MCI0729211.1 cellulose biosynthesis cyclic di-GMP-binding regulatory protein BcsB [Chloroflexota bacterium]
MLVRVIIIFLCLAALFYTTPDLLAQDTEDENIVTFERLNLGRQILQGQFDLVDLFLTIPADWRLLPGAQLELDMTTFVNQLSPEAGAYGGVLEIYFENQLLQTVIVDRSGFQKLVMDIPATALVDLDNNGRFRLQVVFEGAGSCETGPGAITYILVQPTSRFILPHEMISPSTDLQQLPRPFYQRSFTPDEVVMVISDAPTAGELQAAMRVAAALGRMSAGNLLLTTIPAGNLTPEVRDNQHLIIVGQMAHLPLAGAGLPQPFVETLPAHVAEDGILHMALSPWNERKVVLYVTGDTDNALNKAALALSTGFIRTAGQPDSAVIQEVFPERLIPSTGNTTNSLQDLGYETQLVEGIGDRQVAIEFYLPPGQTVDETAGAFFNLVYAHSSLLDYDRSEMNVEVNGERIGSVRLGEPSTLLTSASLPIPAAAVHVGRNTLNLNVDLRPRTSCNDQPTEIAWLAIRSESTLTLPLRPLDNQARAAEVRLLNNYPRPFSFDPTLATTAVVVPAADPLAWQQAAQIVFDLGARVEGGLVGLNLAFADEVSESLRQQNDLLIVGRPTTLPLLAEINDDLPAPFAANINAVQDEQLLVAYNVPATSELGYLQTLAAPWNPERTIVVVSGNSETGLRNATAMLLNSPLRRSLASDFAVVEGQQFYLAARPQETAPQPAATPPATPILSTEQPTPPSPTATPFPQPTPEVEQAALSATPVEQVIQPAATDGALTDNPLFLIIAAGVGLVVVAGALLLSRRFW